MQKPSPIIPVIPRTLFISNISPFCRVLRHNCILASFLSVFPCFSMGCRAESIGSSLLHSCSPGDFSLPKLQADWDVWHPEKWENKWLSHSTVPIALLACPVSPAGLCVLTVLSPWALQGCGQLCPSAPVRDTCFATHSGPCERG